MAGLQNKILFGEGEKLQESSAASILQMQDSATDVSRINHLGDPEGIISANPASLCHDPISGILYLKVSGTGNTGWQAINAGSVVVSAYLNTALANVTGDGTPFNPIMDSTFANTGGAYDTTTGIFTAPVAGNYLYTINLTFTGVTTAYNRGWLISQPSGTNFLSSFFNLGAIFDVPDLAGTISQSAIIPLAANGTLQFECTISGGTKTLGVQGFSGFNGTSSTVGITLLK